MFEVLEFSTRNDITQLKISSMQTWILNNKDTSLRRFEILEFKRKDRTLLNWI